MAGSLLAERLLATFGAFNLLCNFVVEIGKSKIRDKHNTNQSITITSI